MLLMPSLNFLATLCEPFCYKGTLLENRFEGVEDIKWSKHGVWKQRTRIQLHMRLSHWFPKREFKGTPMY